MIGALVVYHLRGRELERGHFQAMLTVTFLTVVCVGWARESLFVDNGLRWSFWHIIIAPWSIIEQVLVVIVVGGSQDVDVSVTAFFLGCDFDVVVVVIIVLLLRNISHFRVIRV